jgi:hypothetical protein
VIAISSGPNLYRFLKEYPSLVCITFVNRPVGLNSIARTDRFPTSKVLIRVALYVCRDIISSDMRHSASAFKYAPFMADAA